MARITLADEDVYAICIAIVHRAAVDYGQARKYFRDIARHRIMLNMTEYYSYERLLRDTERFFESQWFYLMGGTTAMYKRLKRECDRGYYRKEEK